MGAELSTMFGRLQKKNRSALATYEDIPPLAKRKPSQEAIKESKAAYKFRALVRARLEAIDVSALRKGHRPFDWLDDEDEQAALIHEKKQIVQQVCRAPFIQSDAPPSVAREPLIRRPIQTYGWEAKLDNLQRSIRCCLGENNSMKGNHEKEPVSLSAEKGSLIEQERSHHGSTSHWHDETTSDPKDIDTSSICDVDVQTNDDDNDDGAYDQYERELCKIDLLLAINFALWNSLENPGRECLSGNSDEPIANLPTDSEALRLVDRIKTSSLIEALRTILELKFSNETVVDALWVTHPRQPFDSYHKSKRYLMAYIGLLNSLTDEERIPFLEVIEELA